MGLSFEKETGMVYHIIAALLKACLVIKNL